MLALFSILLPIPLKGVETRFERALNGLFLKINISKASKVFSAKFLREVWYHTTFVGGNTVLPPMLKACRVAIPVSPFSPGAGVYRLANIGKTVGRAPVPGLCHNEAVVKSVSGQHAYLKYRRLICNGCVRNTRVMNSCNDDVTRQQCRTYYEGERDMKKRLPVLLVMILMALVVLPVSCFAADPLPEDLFTRNVYPGSTGSYDIGSDDLPYEDGHIENGNFDKVIIDGPVTFDEAQSSATLFEVRADGSLGLAELDNDDAVDNSLFVSKTWNTLVFRDAVGNMHNLTAGW